MKGLRLALLSIALAVTLTGCGSVGLLDALATLTDGIDSEKDIWVTVSTSPGPLLSVEIRNASESPRLKSAAAQVERAAPFGFMAHTPAGVALPVICSTSIRHECDAVRTSERVKLTELYHVPCAVTVDDTTYTACYEAHQIRKEIFR